MQTKLTLSIDKAIIQKAKRFASESNRSLSEIIESYLKRITDHHIDEIDNELDEIIGVIQLPSDYDEKKEIRKILSDKHL